MLTNRLYDWSSVADFRQIVDALTVLLDRTPGSRRTPHRRREFGPGREAWVLLHALEGMGCQARQADQADTGQADAEVDTGTQIQSIEITEVLEVNWLPNVPPPEGARSDGGQTEWRA